MLAHTKKGFITIQPTNRCERNVIFCMKYVILKGPNNLKLALKNPWQKQKKYYL